MRVLITGSQGFIGRHFAQHLQDHAVLGLDVHGPHAVDARRFFAADQGHFDLVVHAAAHVGGRRDIEGRAAFIGAYNLQLDGALFEWALRTKPGRVVYFSSSAAYPVRLQGPGHSGWFAGYATGVASAKLLSEPVALSPLQPVSQTMSVSHTMRVNSRLVENDIDPLHPWQPDATYGWVKLTGERLAAEAEAEGVRVHVFRPFSGYGEDQSEDYPFPSFAARARRRDDPFTIWGDGTQVRDWIHVDDIVAAVMAAVEQDVPGPTNLCTGRGVSFNKLAELFTAEAGYSSRPQHILDAPRGVIYRVGDPTKMLTFYEPKVTLEDGIHRALNIEE